MWPKTTTFKLQRRWKQSGRSYTLTPGRYRWSVWPGLGRRSANNVGAALGTSTFTVKSR